MINQFLFNDIIISNPMISLPDPEFYAEGNLATWQDRDNNLWVAYVNPETGMLGSLDPNTGDFIEGLEIVYENGPIDTNLALQNNQEDGTGNGPEWIYTNNGAEIVYTKEDEQGNRYITKATLEGNQWMTEILTDESGNPLEGYSPNGTLNVGDQVPLLGYRQRTGGDTYEQFWRELDNPSASGSIPASAGRWVLAPEENTMMRIFVDPETGIKQYYTYDVYTEELTQITNDNYLKSGSGIMWYAPEYDDLVFFSSELSVDENGNISPARDQIGIYRQIDGVWTRISTLHSPSAEQPFIHSPEPFIYRGKSYLSLVTTIEDLNSQGRLKLRGSQIWIMGIEEDEPVEYRISVDVGKNKLNDPETFINDQGAYVFYTEITDDKTRILHATSLDQVFGINNNVDNFIPTEVIVSDPTQPLPDPEFDTLNYQVTWQDKQENLWVAPLDPNTGEFLLNQAIKLDNNLAPIPSYRKRTGSGNGPEFIYDGNDVQILYTKFEDLDNDNIIDPNEWYIGRSQLINGEWQSGLLPEISSFPEGNNGINPIGTLDNFGSSARLIYLLYTPKRSDGILAWRNLDGTEGGIISEKNKAMGRWVNNESSGVVFTESVDGIDQVFRFNIDKQQKVQLTFSDTFKDTPFVWEAPEFGNEPALMTVERKRGQLTTIGIYQRDNQGNLIQISTLRPPSDLTNIRSAEPFVFEGKSYISFLMENDKGQNSEVWIAGINEDNPFYRQVNDSNISMVRNDPEAVVINDQVFIYYTERGSSTVYRADTGLGTNSPSTQYDYVGTDEDDDITGGSEDDSIVGLAGRDKLNGLNGNDSIYGGLGRDQLIGGNGNDYLEGNQGNDYLNGGNDNDTLVGAGGSDTSLKSIDNLKGGSGEDIFVLSTANHIFYNGNGTQDYAKILDFDLNEDLIQLKGSFNQYSARNTMQGSILFIKETGEEIALLENIKAGDLNLSNFTFV